VDPSQGKMFGKQLQKLRVGSGLKQAELATQLNCSDDTVSKWERGLRLPENEARVHLIADKLDLSPDERAHLLMLWQGEDTQRRLERNPVEAPPLAPSTKRFYSRRVFSLRGRALVGIGVLVAVALLGSVTWVRLQGSSRHPSASSGGIRISPPSPSSTGWQLGGNAVYDSSRNLHLTTDGQSGAGSAYWSTAISPTSLRATFDETISGRDPADGLAFDLLSANSSRIPSTGGRGAYLGFGPNQGRAVAFVENARPWSCYPSDHFLGITDGVLEPICQLNYLTTSYKNLSALNNATHHVVVVVTWGSRPTIAVTFDRKQVINYVDADTAVPFPSHVFVGFSGGTGNGTETGEVSNVKITYTEGK